MSIPAIARSTAAGIADIRAHHLYGVSLRILERRNVHRSHHEAPRQQVAAQIDAEKSSAAGDENCGRHERIRS